MLEKNKVSIIMPAYNAKDNIRYALDSIINQTYQNFEVIVVNDKSTDEILEILEEYEKKDNRIKVYSNEVNLKVAKTRNRAIEKATGQFLAFLDSDDEWHQDKLEKQINLFQ